MKKYETLEIRISVIEEDVITSSQTQVFTDFEDHVFYEDFF